MIQPVIGVRFSVDGQDVDVVYGPLEDGSDGWTVHASDDIDLDAVGDEQGAEALLVAHGLIPMYETLQEHFAVLTAAAKQARERDAVHDALGAQLPHTWAIPSDESQF